MKNSSDDAYPIRLTTEVQIELGAVNVQVVCRIVY